MDPVDGAVLEAGRGIVGNVAEGRTRQVTILTREAWDRATAPLEGDPNPSARRANLLVSGVSLAETTKRVLGVGDLRIRILGETNPCERMDEASPGLRGALAADWGGGAFGEVLDSGRIAVGDPVRWMEGPGETSQPPDT